jgi:hypothetical protein
VPRGTVGRICRVGIDLRRYNFENVQGYIYETACMQCDGDRPGVWSGTLKVLLRYLCVLVLTGGPLDLTNANADHHVSSMSS